MAYEKYTKTSDGAALVTLSDMQDYLKVDDPGDNALIQSLIDGWTLWTEEYCWSSFNETGWTLTMEELPSKIVIRKNPIKAITSIKYQDEADAEQTLATTDYKVYKDIPGVIEIIGTIPSLYDRVDAVSIVFTTENTGSLPLVKVALKSLIGLQYLEREDFKPDGPYISFAKRILAPYRLNYF